MRDSESDHTYTVVFPDDEDWTFWTQRYQDLGDDATWEDLQMTLCGVWPTASYTDNVPSTHDECDAFAVWCESVVISVAIFHIDLWIVTGLNSMNSDFSVSSLLRIT